MVPTSTGIFDWASFFLGAIATILVWLVLWLAFMWGKNS